MILLISFDNLLYLSVQNPVPVQPPTDAMPWGAPRQMLNGGHWISNKNVPKTKLSIANCHSRMHIWPFLKKKMIGPFPIVFICSQKLMISFDNLLYLSVQNPVPVQPPTDTMPWGAPRQMPNGGHWISNRNYDCSICICCICICAFQSYPKSRAPVSKKMLLFLAYPKVSKNIQNATYPPKKDK